MNKLENLKQIKKQLNVQINGLENYPIETPSIIVSNHNCLMDIFYQPMALNQPIISLISPRLIYKKIKERQEVIEKYLYAMPIEAHGGKIYSELCLKQAIDILNENISIGIFPEGAYIDDKTTVYKGRTGATRILFEACKQGLKVNFVPIAINVVNETKDLDNYDFKDKKTIINILKPIRYENEYDKFQDKNITYKNEALHQVTDTALYSIAQSLNRQYNNEYIELFKKGNVIFSNGEIISNELNINQEYINRYENELNNRKKTLCKQIKHNQ